MRSRRTALSGGGAAVVSLDTSVATAGRKTREDRMREFVSELRTNTTYGDDQRNQLIADLPENVMAMREPSIAMRREAAGTWGVSRLNGPRGTGPGPRRRRCSILPLAYITRPGFDRCFHSE